jgi:bifunctional DNase/RNase
VVIYDLKDDIFYGKIRISATEEPIEIESRPSDAIALAIRAGVPILTHNSVLEEAGIVIDRESDKSIPKEVSQKTNVGIDEFKGLSAYTEFINTLNVDDFDKELKEE